MHVFISWNVIIISQCICISNHHIVHLSKSGKKCTVSTSAFPLITIIYNIGMCSNIQYYNKNIITIIAG